MERIYPITKKKKAKIYADVYLIKDNIFNIEYIKTLKEIDNIRNINLKDFFKIDTEKYFECVLIKGNIAWLGVSNEGVWRYFTQSKFRVIHAFDIIDLLSIYYNTDFKGVIKELKRMDIKYKNVWREEQKKKYDDNDLFLNEIKEYKYVDKILDENIELLRLLNKFGRENFLSNKVRYEGESIFFIATSYARNMFKPKSSLSTINQSINLLAVLGLLNKVPFNYPKIEYKGSDDICVINYYSMPKMENVIEKANEIAKILIDNDIRYYDITKNKLTSLFGIDFASKIYGTKLGGGDKKKVSINCKEERAYLEHLFKISYIEDGYVCREKIKEQSSYLSDKSFERFWIGLVNSYEGKTIIPSKLIQEKLNLSSRQGIFIRDSKGLENLNS